MLSKEDNELLTRIGPGTPAGNLLRRYWHPICPVSELSEQSPKKRLRVLGEDLLLFRDGKGRIGLVAEQCAHRRASLYYGFIEEDGIRCPYHGWKYDVSGKCTEQPFEPADSPLKSETCQSNYEVQSLAGMYWAYMGPKPALLGVMAGYFSLWSVYWVFKQLTGKEGMGHGDFKLLAAIGAWVGLKGILPTILLSSIVGAIIGSIFLAVKGKDRSTQIPFGPYLAIAGWIAFFWSDKMVATYLQMFGLGR